MVKGDIVETEGSGYVTTFVMDVDEPLVQRSNKRHDELIEAIRLNQKELESFTSRRDIQNTKKRHREAEMGLRRCCIFRELKYFDVGLSFMVDSLHNIYLGAFVSLTNFQLLITFIFRNAC